MIFSLNMVKPSGDNRSAPILTVRYSPLMKVVGVEPITTFIRGGRMRWYGHVMRKGDEEG